MEPGGIVGENDTTVFEYHNKSASPNNVTFCPPKIEYSIYGILNFLQSEYTKMSVERSRWEYEKAELQAKISALQIEKKGQENLKNDLVRRIKMLEYALRQERFKNFALKCPNEVLTNVPGSENQEGHKNSKELNTMERSRLREYLTRIGMSNLATDLRINKVKELLGISLNHGESEIAESALVDFPVSSNPSKDGLLASSEESTKDPAQQYIETASALSEFDQLVAQHSDDLGVLEVDPLVDTMSFTDIMEPPRSWAFGDQSEFVDRLKENFRLGLKTNRVSQSQQGSQSDASQPPIPLHAYDEMELFASHGRRFHHSLAVQQQQPSPQILPGEVILLGSGSGSVGGGGGGGGGGGLGDLANLTSASALDNLDGVVQTPQLCSVGDEDEDTAMATAVKLPVAWTAKYTLRCHFDGIRSVIFHHSEQTLLTGSEDCTLRLWNLTKKVQPKRSSCLDVEPIYTCRGHTSPVLCVALLSVPSARSEVDFTSGRSSPLEVRLENNFAFSGSLDGEIRSWRLGGLQLVLYESFDPSVTGPLFRGHTNAVWSLAVRADGTLLSASADGTVQLWNTFPTLLQQPQPLTKDATVLSASRIYRPALSGSLAVPTSVIFLSSSEECFAVGLTNGEVCVIHLDTGRHVHRFELASPKSDDAAGALASVNALCSHPTRPLLFVAHENRQIRFLDTKQGSCLHSMVAHLEGVTSLASDPRGDFLLSASHDSSIRLWDVESRTCVQEFTSHRKKHDESIHSVAFHPTQPLIASAGADGLAKVYV